MRKEVCTLGVTTLVFLILIAVMGTLYIYRTPVVQGQSLEDWILQLANNNPNNQSFGELDHGQLKLNASQEKAAAAIRQSGTNCLPYLLQALTKNDLPRWIQLGPFRIRYNGLDWKHRFTSVECYNRGAVLGFLVLGPTAEPSDSELIRLLNRKDLPTGIHYDAALALAATGPKGREVLIGRLLNEDAPYGSYGHVRALIDAGEATSKVAAALMQAAEADSSRAASLISSLGQIGKSNRAVVPFLVHSLESTDLNVRREAIRSLGNLGEQGEIAVPALARCLRTENEWQAAATLLALGKFNDAVEQVFPLLLAQLQSTNGTEWAAVMALGELGPLSKRALPLLISRLAELENTNGRHWLPACLHLTFMKQRRFFHAILPWDHIRPRTVPESLALLADTLSRIDSNWTNHLPPLLAHGPTLEDWRAVGRNVEPTLHGPTLAEWLALATNSEPQLGGRSITEWLRFPAPIGATRPFFREGDLSRLEVEAAVRSIGTNAIPWLFSWLLAPKLESGYACNRGFSILQRMALSAMPALAELVQADLQETRDRAYRCIKRINPEWDTVWPTLLPALHDSRESVRFEAADYLCEAFPEESKRAGVYALVPACH